MHISEEQLKKFLAGELNKEQKAQYEEFLNKNPFEKEAWEGLQMLSTEELEQDLNELKQKITFKANKKVLPIRAIAASVAILLIGISLAIYFAKLPDTDTSMSFESSTKQEIQTQEPKKIDAQEESYTKNDQNNSLNPIRREEILPQMEKSESRKNIEKEASDISVAEKTIVMSEDTETKKQGKVEKIDKTMEQDKIAEIYTEDKMIENARQEGGAVQTEKPQNSSTENEQTDKKQKAKKYAAAPQENRALNMAKDEAFQSQSVVLQGQILDAQTKKGLKNTKISLKEYPQTTQTDSLGNFSFNVPVRIKYVLIVEKPDYQILETETKPHQKNIFFLKK